MGTLYKLDRLVGRAFTSVSGSSIVVVTGWALITIGWNRDPYWSILRKQHSERLTGKTTSKTGAKCLTNFGGRRPNESRARRSATTWRRFEEMSDYLALTYCSICPLDCKRTAHLAHASVVESMPSRTESGHHAEGESCGSTHTKRGQVMLCPQPLLELPCEAEHWQGAHKRRTSNVMPSTIT